MSSDITQKISHVKLIVLVDEIITDGRLFFSSKGENIKKFNTRDGMGVELLKKINIKILFVSKTNSQIILKRVKKIKISKLYSNVKNKSKKFKEILKEYNLSPNEVMYIGFDLDDLEAMREAVFSACSKNASIEIKKNSDFICKNNSGYGILREIEELILSAKSKKK